MTVVGSVEVDVVALVNGSAITRQMSAGLDKPAKTAGQAAGRTMGKHLGDSAAAELEKSGARFARSGRLLSNVFTQNSASALGPLQEVADKVQLIGSTLDSTKTKAGGLLLGIGAAATGVGAFLSTLASREQGATNRLAASIAATGGNIDDYRDRIDKAVTAGEKFGQSGNQTIDALQALTIGLHDPKKALDELGLAEDIAAAKQIPLTSAANLVRQAYNGNTRVLKAFGIQVADVVDGQKLLADAHATATKAASDASKAQHDYSNKLAIYKDTLKPTLSQQLALKDAHDKLTVATAEQAVAQQGLADAQKKANDAGSKGQEVLDKLAHITAGQASASADTFTGHLKAYGAAIEDNAAKIGGKAGKALIEFGPALAAGGFLIESGLIPKLGRGVAALLGFGGQAAATAVEVEGASTAEVASFDTVVLAIRDLQFALTGIGPAAGAAAVEVGTATTAMDAEIAGVGDVAIATSGKLRTMVGLAGGLGGALGSLAMLGPGIFPDLHSTAPGGLTGRQKNLFSDALNLSYGHSRDDLAKASRSDLLAVLGKFDPKSKDTGINDARSFLLQLTGQSPPSSHRTDVQDVQDAKDAAHAAVLARLHPTAPKPVPKPQTLEEFLKSLGLGPVANSALDKVLSEHQKAAGERARAIGTEVTRGMRAQVATVKQEISGLTAELKKISDLRGQVVGQAGSFTSLTGLLPDNSLATAGGLVAGLQSRVGAEGLFGKNLTSLSKRGLDKGVIAEILQAGPEQARSIAAALAQGPDSAIRQLNLAEKAARQQAQVLGNEAVSAQFGAGAQAKANAELVKLNAQIAKLNAQIAAEPTLIAKAVDQARKNAAVTTRSSTRTAVPR